MSFLRQDFVTGYLGFSNNYFDNVVVTVQGSFTRDVRITSFTNSLKGCFFSLNLIYNEAIEKATNESL